jgi:voltage-gated potassium channel
VLCNFDCTKNRLTDPLKNNMQTKTPLQRIRIGALSLGCVLILSVTGYHFLGGYDWLDAVWMVVITVSTVGYSENTQSTSVVQILTIGVILLGVTSSVYTCGGFIQLMLEGEVERALGKRKMSKEIKRLNGHVIICGFGRLGLDLVNQLQHRGIPFVVVDIDPEKIVQASEAKVLAIHGDATSEQVLQAANLSAARALVTALPSDAENVFITLTARNLRPDIQIIAKSEQESSCRKLRQAGADKIVMPHRVGAQQMERMISRPTTADLVELFAEASHLEMELDEFRVSRHSDLVGTALADSNIKEQFNLLVVGIKNREGEFRFNPPPHETIGVEDTLLVIGQVDDINRMKLAHQI